MEMNLQNKHCTQAPLFLNYKEDCSIMYDKDYFGNHEKQRIRCDAIKQI